MRKKSTKPVNPEKRIELFLKRYVEMWELPTIQKGFKVSLKHHNDFIKKEISSSLIEPDNEGFRGFMTYFRKFVFDNSPYRIDKIFKICRFHLTDEDCKKRLGAANRQYNQILARRKGWNLPRDGKILTPEEFAKVWLNGEIFHDDIDGVEFLESLDPSDYDIWKFEFLAFVVDVSNLIRYVAHEVNEAKKNGWFKF